MKQNDDELKNLNKDSEDEEYVLTDASNNALSNMEGKDLKDPQNIIALYNAYLEKGMIHQPGSQGTLGFWTKTPEPYLEQARCLEFIKLKIFQAAKASGNPRTFFQGHFKTLEPILNHQRTGGRHFRDTASRDNAAMIYTLPVDANGMRGANNEIKRLKGVLRDLDADIRTQRQTASSASSKI